LLIGSIVFLLGWRWQIIRARRRTSRTTGTVVRVAMRRPPLTLTWEPSPDIEFVDDRGNKHLCKSGYGTSWNQWPVGSKVDVTYDPDDPTNCELVLPRGMVMMLMLVGIFFALLAAWFLYDALQSVWG
jgi:hypothetical protein